MRREEGRKEHETERKKGTGDRSKKIRKEEGNMRWEDRTEEERRKHETEGGNTGRKEGT